MSCESGNLLDMRDELPVELNTPHGHVWPQQSVTGKRADDSKRECYLEAMNLHKYLLGL